MTSRARARLTQAPFRASERRGGQGAGGHHEFPFQASLTASCQVTGGSWRASPPPTPAPPIHKQNQTRIPPAGTHVKAGDDLAKDGVVAVQVRGGAHHDAEVAGVGVGPGVGHGQQALRGKEGAAGGGAGRVKAIQMWMVCMRIGAWVASLHSQAGPRQTPHRVLHPYSRARRPKWVPEAPSSSPPPARIPNPTNLATVLQRQAARGIAHPPTHPPPIPPSPPAHPPCGHA